ncbi:hypothetical protein [Dawidia soli]|uniref:Uncharacterized protein n=1 Tax=Dawidia soli TaxID=2782352 RepID=A0AAP2DHE0_9BACT|nr:hypothetical protein [Dawidia soli]MBT1689412.1 hypothetical protein [Dawidia soli]
MKKAWKLSWSLIILLAASVAFTACSDDDDDNGGNEQPTALEPADGETLIGEVKSGETMTLKADRSFTIDKALRVRDGGTLKIEAGVTVTASEDASATAMFIVIEQGGKIDAQGTAEKPIVLTAAVKEPASWGGMMICGRAPINLGTSATAEIGDAIYGGTVANDNSGTLKYVRIEYSGSRINDDAEHNGFTFYGVGNGTTVDHIEAYKGSDDGIEIFGGTVKMSYVVAYGSQDDQFDWSQGWVGGVDYLYTEQVNDADYRQDKGIEADNQSNHTATPISNPTLKNVTIMGYPDVLNGDDEVVDGIRIRVGSKGNLDNVVIIGYSGDGVDARNYQTLNSLADGSLIFTNLFTQGTARPFAVSLDGDEDPSEGTVVGEAGEALEAAIVANEPTGANFDSWKGTWAKVN